MTNAYKSKVDAEKWLRDGHVVTPYASEMIQAQRKALPSSGTTTFVQFTRGLGARHRVNVGDRTCTCSYIHQYGLPAPTSLLR